MKTKNERILARRVMAVVTEVESALKRDHGVKWFRMKQDDEIKLLRLKQWEEKYRVSIRYMLSKLIPFWTKKYAQYSRRVVFGTTIATLVGRVSEDVLVGKIREDFPDGENLARWKAITQQKQWARIWDQPKLEFSLNPVQALKEYKQRVQSERRDRKKWAKDLSQRRYRGNPW